MLPYTATAQLFSQGGITLSQEQYEKLSLYASLLLEWNQKINLTAITDDEGIAVKHFFDSVYPFTLADIPQGAGVIDVGTGAGFPSCPLKIFRDDLELTLLDSLNKRINFLAELSDRLDLRARCIHGRAEEMGRTDLRETFDIATARAVAELGTLCEYCLPFVKVGGSFIALKGDKGPEEAKAAAGAIKTLGGKLREVREYQLPGGDRRALIVIGKVGNTPKAYPRNAGQIKKKKL